MNLQNILYTIPAILLALTIHECSHALCAWKLGDNTARDQGRITLNPLKHIDIIGFLFIMIAGFGWAKPVQFNPQNLKHYRRDRALIAAAGPFSNLIMGIIFTFFLWHLAANLSEPNRAMQITTIVISHAAAINFGLFIFNLLPIPPLDGSHIVFSGFNFKPELERLIMKIGMPLLFIILIVQNTMNITIIPIGRMVWAMMLFFLRLFYSV